MPEPQAMPLWGVQDQLASCIQCAACVPACPTYAAVRRETVSPRGRLALAVGLLEGQVRPAEGAFAAISSCIDCRACVPACPRHIPLAEVFYAAKAQLAALGGGGIAARLLRLVSRWVLVRNRLRLALHLGRPLVTLYHGIADASPVAKVLPFFRDGRKRVLPDLARQPMTDEYPEVIRVRRPRGRVAFFPGCVINFTATEIGHATISALHKLEVEIVLPDEAPCCGIPLLSVGEREGAKRVARDVIRRYGSLDVDAIVTACASCGTTLRDTYPLLLADTEDAEAARAFAARVMDVTEYVTARTAYAERAGRVVGAVTYHDPCHLVRGMGVTEEPREILTRLAGEGFTEMDGADRCCGFGGLFSALHYDMALEVGADKARSVAASGAKVVATGCPGCQMQMTDSLERGGVTARVVHTMELLDMALDPPPDRPPAAHPPAPGKAPRPAPGAAPNVSGSKNPAEPVRSDHNSA
jgi:glycolate oxidase iron-sulfur subunit